MLHSLRSPQSKIPVWLSKIPGSVKTAVKEICLSICTGATGPAKLPTIGGMLVSVGVGVGEIGVGVVVAVFVGGRGIGVQVDVGNGDI